MRKTKEKNKRMICSLLLALIFLLLPQVAFAVEPLNYLHDAQTLKTLGLFLGTENGFELDRSTTRAESAVMLTRLLGKEQVAQENKVQHPFTDVYSWAEGYIGYLYQQKLTNGVNVNQFGSGEATSPQQFVTFVLRALGYQDSKGDFSYENALEKGLEIGLYNQEEYAVLQKTTEIPRGYCVMISYHALFVPIKDADISLLEKLYLNDGAIKQDHLLQAMKGNDTLSAFVEENLDLSTIQQGLTASEISKIASPAVFLVEVYNKQEVLLGTGSGFFISSDGKFVTNYHVIEDAHSAKIQLTNGKVYPVATVLGVDKVNDLAILKIDTTEAMPYLEIADSDLIENGDKIYAIGSPKGLANTISEGIISNKQQKVNGDTLIQISAPISAGSSGGALLNDRGQVIGVTSSGLPDAQNIGFAVYSNWIDKIVLTNGKSLALLFDENHNGLDIVEDEGTYWEQEPNDNFTKANVFPADEMIMGNIDIPYDVDVYRVSVTERKHIAVGLISGDDWYTQNMAVMLLDSQEQVVAISNTEIVNGAYMQTLYGTIEAGDYYLVLLQAGPDAQDSLWYDVPYYMIYFYE